MARTFAGNSTSRIDRVLALQTIQCYSIWTYRTGDGGGSGGRIWDVGAGANGGYVMLLNSGGSSEYNFQRRWDAQGQWTIVRPSADAWHHLCITYNGGSTANNPVIYVDGASVAVTRVTAPTGTLDTSTPGLSVILGNRIQFDREWAGSLAEFAFWNGVVLDAGEAMALSRGIPAYQVRPASLVEYAPLMGRNSPEIEVWRAATYNVTGTSQGDHPPVMRPKRRQVDQFGVNAPTGRILVPADGLSRYSDMTGGMN